MNEHHWQDARLKKALEHAPDQDQKPSRKVREHILTTAKQAAHSTPTSQKSWWSSIAHFLPNKANRPWSAALGTALVIGCVGIIWFNQDLETAFEAPPTELFPAERHSETLSTEPALALPLPESESTMNALDQISDATTIHKEKGGEQASELTLSTQSVETQAEHIVIQKPTGESLQASLRDSMQDATQDSPLANATTAPLTAPPHLDVPATPTTPQEITSHAPARLPQTAIEERKTRDIQQFDTKDDQALKIEMDSSKQTQASPEHRSRQTEDTSRERLVINGNYDNGFTSSLDSSQQANASILSGKLAGANVADTSIASEAVQSVFETPPASAELLHNILAQWDMLDVTLNNQTHIFQRDQVSSFANALSNSITQPRLLQDAPSVEQSAWQLVFYIDTVKQGIFLAQGQTWFFIDEQNNIWSGRLSQQDTKQLEETLQQLIKNRTHLN